MVTRAYDKFFLPGVMKNLGFAVDFAVNGCGVSADSFVRFDRTPEYWAGWILAYYQWETNLSFLKIRDFVRFSQIINMYEPLHEAPAVIRVGSSKFFSLTVFSGGDYN